MVTATSLLATLGVSCAERRRPTHTPEQFTDAVSARLQAALPGWAVRVAAPLRLVATSPTGEDNTLMLDNAYELADQDADGLERWLANSADMLRRQGEAIRAEQIVPVVRARSWLDQDVPGVDPAGPRWVYDDLCDDLIVVYGIDTPYATGYLLPRQVDELGLAHGDLRNLAGANLLRLVGDQITCRQIGPVILITVDGTYDASLLALDAPWQPGAYKLRGELVVAVPNRDFCVLTGSDHADGVQTVQRMAADRFANYAYAISPHLYRRRDGAWQRFEG